MEMREEDGGKEKGEKHIVLEERKRGRERMSYGVSQREGQRGRGRARNRGDAGCHVWRRKLRGTEKVELGLDLWPGWDGRL